MNKFCFIVGCALLFFSCRKDTTVNLGDTTPYVIDYPERLAKYLPPISSPSDNPLTVEGVELGRKLFYDERLSGDNTMSCSSCHAPDLSFSDPFAVSEGIDGIFGRRNSMNLINLAWMKSFFWDGRKATLEDQAYAPVNDVIELHGNWSHVEEKLQADNEYPALFEIAFGSSKIDSIMISKALAQFERTLISGDSPMDKFMNANSAIGSSGWSMENELAAYQGFVLFVDEEKGDCFHCHGDNFNPLWTDNLFHNNGLDEVVTDQGLGEVTGNPSDYGKFKTPTLRNLVFTAPYMHDGRFETLDEVIDHYSEGLKHSPTIDPLMKKVDAGGALLTSEEKYSLKMFLISLSDSSFVNNPNFSDPG